MAWATDIHLDHAVEMPRDVGRRFAREAPEADALLLTGDLSVAGDEQASTLRQHLLELHEGWARKIFFVLGNHDIYGARFAEVHRAIATLCAEEPALVWLRKSGPVRLSERTMLVGHDGFYDTGHGDPNAGVRLNDSRRIGDLAQRSPSERTGFLKGLGHRSAKEAREGLRAALADAPHVVFATHVPPFPEMVLFRGEPTPPAFLPWYCNRAMGEMLRATADEHPTRAIAVLSGHAHGANTITTGTITAHVGFAEYGYPRIASVFAW